MGVETPEATQSGNGWVGQSLKRKEDPRLITGQATYVEDIMLPGMNGYVVCRTLRDEQNWTPVLMLTAMTDEPSTRAGFEAGVTDYVTKPFSIPQLTARVRACLARTQLL